MPSPGEGGKSAATIDRILEAARTVFGDKGLEGATMDGIAETARLSKQIIYYYFGTKDALYSEVVKRLIVSSHLPILDFDYSALDAVAALRAFFQRAFDANTANATSFALDQMMLGSQSVIPAEGSEAYGRQVTRLLASLVERGQREGSIRADVEPLMLHIHLWLLNVGFLSAQPMMAKYLDEDISPPEFARAWRDYATRLIDDCVAARPSFL